MLLFLVASAFAQSAAAPAEVAPAYGPEGSSWLERDGDFRQPRSGAGDLEAPGYCSRRARARNAGAMEEG